MTRSIHSIQAAKISYVVMSVLLCALGVVLMIWPGLSVTAIGIASGVMLIVLGLVKLLDRYGLAPKALLDELPFHTSMYVTNMASIGMTRVYHHIYNFGNTSLFFSMGTPQRSNQPDMKGEISRKCILPIGITADERVCSGAIYAKLFAVMKHCLSNPYELEQPPEKVYYNEGCEFHEPKPGAAAEARKAGASA